MIAAVESLREVGQGTSWSGERRAAEWEDIVAEHLRDDWPPPEWVVRAERAPAPPRAERDAA